MRRREFLQGTAGGALAWQLAVWSAACGRAQAQASGTAPGAPPHPWTPAAELARLRASAQAARDGKRPLLLLILPADRRKRWEHGQAWAELVLYGPPRAVAALATCELACGRLPAAREAFACLVDVPDEELPALVLELETRSVRPVSADLTAKHSPFPSLEADESLRARMQRLAAALELALAPDAAALELRLRAAARERGMNPAPEDALNLEALAERVRAELGTAPPSGAAWATANPCGARVDHPLARNIGGPCGTAHVPRLSQRFLFYLVDLEHA